MRLEPIEGYPGDDGNATRVDFRMSPPAEQCREALGTAFLPIQLRGEVIDPALAEPGHGVGEELVVLIHADLDIRGGSIPAVDPERADTKKQAGPGGVNGLAEITNQQMHILAAPVGLGQRASGGSVGGVGFIVRKIREAALGTRVGVEIVVEVNSGDVVAIHEFADDGIDVAAHLGRSGIHPKGGADFVAVLREAAADVIGGSRMGGIRGGAIGVDPSVNLQPARLGLSDEKGEWVIAWIRSLCAGKVATPWLQA